MQSKLFLYRAQLHPSLDNTDATTHTFVLQTFASIVDCQVCHKLLKGLLDQVALSVLCYRMTV